MNSKFVNASVFIVSAGLFLFNLFLLAKHLDYFSTRILTSATIIDFKESTTQGDSRISLEYQNSFKKRVDTSTISFSREFRRKLTGQTKADIYYTKYFKQTMLKGYKNPRHLIFLLDGFLLLLFYFGIRAGLSGLKKK